MTNKPKYVGFGIALGAALGAALGVIAGHVGVWLAIGVAIGMLLGAASRRTEAICAECAEIHHTHAVNARQLKAKS